MSLPLLFISVWLGSAGAQAHSEGGSVPITVLSSRVDLAQETVTFTLQNDSRKAITAWEVWFQFGSDPRRSGVGVDAYRSFAGVVDGGSHLPPGGTVTMTGRAAKHLSDRDMIFPHVVVTPTSAIFADTTFAGERAFAERTFQLRRQAAKEWREILAALHRARNGGAVTVDTLQFVRDQLDASIAKDKDAVVPRQVRTNVGIFLNQVRGGSYTAAQRLDFLLDQARRELAAAIAHSRARN